MKILLADDDWLARTATVRLLEYLGHEVTSVAGGQEVLDIMKQDDVPLVWIIDWMMPGIDGLEVCRRVRRSDLGSRVYLIMLSGNHNQKDEIKGLAAGADDYIVKPCNSNDLQSRLDIAESFLRDQLSQ